MPTYKIVEELPPKTRTKAAKIFISHNGKETLAFRKSSEDEKVARLIRHQAESAELVNQIGAQSNSTFRAPETYVAGPGFIVTEWIEGEPISKSLAEDPVRQAEIMAPMLWAFDKYGAKPDKPPSYSFFRTFPESLSNWRAEIQEYVNAGSIDQGTVDQTFSLLETLYPKLTSCLQDADIKPAHLYNDPSGKTDFVLIDSEHIRDNWPRYYDLGNLIAKYTVSKPLPAFNNKLLADFLRLSDASADEIFNQLQATLLVRGIGFIKEQQLPPASNDSPSPKLVKILIDKALTAQSVHDLL